MIRLIFIFLLLFSINSLSQGIDSLEVNEDESKQELNFTKSPSEAVYKSLIFPGWGQFYTEDYWKIPIVTGAFTTLIYLAILNHQDYQEFRDLEFSLPEGDLQRLQAKSNKEFYQDQRDQLIFYTVGVYLIAAIDAYVAAHLFDFSVEDDLSIGFTRNSIGINTIYLQISL